MNQEFQKVTVFNIKYRFSDENYCEYDNRTDATKKLRYLNELARFKRFYLTCQEKFI